MAPQPPHLLPAEQHCQEKPERASERTSCDLPCQRWQCRGWPHLQCRALGWKGKQALQDLFPESPAHPAVWGEQPWSQKQPPWPKVGKSREWLENGDNEDPETPMAGAGFRGRKEQVESWSRKGAKNPQEPLVPRGPGGRVEVSCYHDCLHNSVGWAEQVIRAPGFLSSVTSQLFHTGQLTSPVSASHAWKPEGCEPQSRRFFTVLKFSESSHPLTSEVIMVIFCRLHPLFSRYRAALEMKPLDDPPPVRDGI